MTRFYNQKGMTLTEVLVAIAVIGIMMTAILNSMTGSFKINVDAKQRTQAIALADKLNEEIRRYGFVTDPATGMKINSGTETLLGKEYSWELVEDMSGSSPTVAYSVYVNWVGTDGKSGQYELASVRAR